MAGKVWFFKGKLVEVGILTSKHDPAEVIIQCWAPVFCSISDIAIG